MSPEAEAFAAHLPLLESAVREAGEAAMGFFRNAPKVWDKAGHGPVSEADFAANEVLERRLRGSTPDIGWLSEESTDSDDRLGRRAVWIVDPIDGTRAFLDGKPEFTICAGLTVDGTAVAGAVFNPCTGELFSAAQDSGARLGSEPLQMSPPDSLDGARVLATRKSWKAENWRDDVPEATRGYVNSIAYRLCLVAAGRWDACIALNGFSDWDAAAADIVVREAGGRITDRRGEALRFNSETARIEGLIAAHPTLHETISVRMAPTTRR